MFSRIMRGVMPFIRAAPRVAHPHVRVIPQTRVADFHAQARSAVHKLLSTILPTPIRGSIPANFSSATRVARLPSSLPFTARSKLILGPSARPNFMPRGPAIPRSTMEVGLGPARNFSSSRPLFQNLAQNASIAIRAFSEADWELERREANRRKALQIMKGKRVKVSTPRAPRLSPKDKSMKASFDRYFAAPPTPEVTTYLTIPLAPSEARAPLPSEPSATLLDPTVASIHESYQRHAARVDSLLRRLDAAHVFDRGATEEVYGTASFGENRGVCSVLRIKFSGWTMEMVREVIGEAGIGWCELEEVSTMVTETSPPTPAPAKQQDPLDEPLPLQPLLPLSPELDRALADEATSSFIMPTLDFSSSFSSFYQDTATPSPLVIDLSSGTSTPAVFSAPSTTLGSPMSELSDLVEFTPYYDSDSSSSSASDDGSWSVPSRPSPSNSMIAPTGWIGFSSDFSNRVNRDFYF